MLGEQAMETDGSGLRASSTYENSKRRINALRKMRRVLRHRQPSPQLRWTWKANRKEHSGPQRKVQNIENETEIRDWSKRKGLNKEKDPRREEGIGKRADARRQRITGDKWVRITSKQVWGRGRKRRQCMRRADCESLNYSGDSEPKIVPDNRRSKVDLKVLPTEASRLRKMQTQGLILKIQGEKTEKVGSSVASGTGRGEERPPDKTDTEDRAHGETVDRSHGARTGGTAQDGTLYRRRSTQGHYRRCHDKTGPPGRHTSHRESCLVLPPPTDPSQTWRIAREENMFGEMLRDVSLQQLVAIFCLRKMQKSCRKSSEMG